MKCQILFSGNGDNLHETSNPAFWEKMENINLSVELAQRVVRIKASTVPTGIIYNDLGPVVQSFVSLTSSLRIISLTILGIQYTIL